jgi:SAM-dependent methyltransferase
MEGVRSLPAYWRGRENNKREAKLYFNFVKGKVLIMTDKFNNGELYEAYIGRWSRLIAAEFTKWINRDSGLVWIDVGCGTGVITGAILNNCNPKKVIGIDPSEEQIRFAGEKLNDSRVKLYTGDAYNLPVDDHSADVIVAGLVLNFIPDIEKALTGFKRAARSGAMICGYVWDYAGKMEMLRYFFDAAVTLFDDALEHDEGVRFKICNPDVLFSLFTSAGLKNVEVTNLDIPTVFKDFNDYWNPFLSGVGPAPGYCMSLTEDKRELLKEKIYSSLPIEKDGSIKLTARAFGVKGER